LYSAESDVMLEPVDPWRAARLKLPRLIFVVPRALLQGCYGHHTSRAEYERPRADAPVLPPGFPVHAERCPDCCVPRHSPASVALPPQNCTRLRPLSLAERAGSPGCCAPLECLDRAGVPSASTE